MQESKQKWEPFEDACHAILDSHKDHSASDLLSQPLRLL